MGDEVGAAVGQAGQAPTTPRLAIDVWRHALCLLLTCALLGAGTVAYLAAADAELLKRVESPYAESLEMLALIGAMLFVYGSSYAVLTLVVFRRYRGDALRRVASDSAAISSQRRIALYLLGGDEITFPVSAAFAALVGVVALVLAPEFTSDLTLAVGALAGLIGGWIMMVTSFTTTYLREWALRDAVRFPEPRHADGGALRSSERRMSDFVFVAVQFATAYSSTDFSLVAPRVRVFASINSVLAFLYGTVIIGMFLSFAVSAGLGAA
ncbi:hypothetical protein GCM10011490_19820 [Pseudoclavibacter endophyticus]|uniref:DUF1345 domain-containing protein n=1 Tax=Pseudoclavibacter endophyticus TaxID=1778590 RepID=A0A6H9WN42_9MICO|nr:DUF1345 domain-containing protein [Pseudoclavibacter endophyticus]KAB1648046.1 DUF1345 domain-containing protein [Pseudoclavibacter endophyticus]GGA69254.1 hypothetical protein GCM10011490_19820 [Pseudoclavibacter endophyticus]